MIVEFKSKFFFIDLNIDLELKCIWTPEHLSLFPSLSISPSGGLSAGQPYSQLPGAAVRPSPPATPVGSHLPGSHLAELWPCPLVRSSRQRPWETLHPAVRSSPWGKVNTGVWAWLKWTKSCFYDPSCGKTGQQASIWVQSGAENEF